MTWDPDPPVIDPPPLPASHATQKHRWRESLAIPAQFYLEVLAVQLLLVMGVYVAQRLVPTVAGFALFSQPFLWFWLVWRLAKRVLEARRLRGKPRPEATALFVVAMIAPAIALLGISLSVFRRSEVSTARQQAMTELKRLYVAERAFRADFGRYTLSATELSGFRIPENDQPYYQLGFATACSVKAGVDRVKAQWPVLDPTHVRARRGEIEAYFLGVRTSEACKDPQSGFEAFAVGTAHDGGPLDAMVIDEHGKIRDLD